MIKHKWANTVVWNTDGSASCPDAGGNELRFLENKTFIFIADGFANPLGLEFVDPDGIEYIVLREIDDRYHFAELMLDQNSLAIDIGAHVGVVSMTLAKRYGCKVLAYEPAPDNYRRLVANIKANGLESLIEPHNLAVTDDGREVPIGGDPEQNSGGMSIYNSVKVSRIASTTLKDIISGREIDLLKIDCEGAEYEILADLSPLVHVKAIRGEFHELRLGAFTITPDSLLPKVKKVVPDTIVCI